MTFPSSTYTNRRKGLVAQLDKGIILLMGNDDAGMNYAGNTYFFRQDSTFLYYCGIDQPGLAAIIDIESGETTIYGDELSVDDIVWMGQQATIRSKAEKAGISNVQPSLKLGDVLKVAQSSGRDIHYLPPYRGSHKIKYWDLLGIAPKDQKGGVSVPLIKAVVAQRSIKTAEEVVELEKAVRVTNRMHLAAMRGARPGASEAYVTGLVHSEARAGGGNLSFPIILSVDGQILHNHHHDNIMKEGDLVLCDSGAEVLSRYSGDMTRTFPAGATFTQKQKEVYQIVLDANMAVINSLKPGLPYREMHDLSSRVIASGLKELGLMKGDVDDAVAKGAHALFFPHGLGHMMGLDVHDMENLGEDYVGYTDTIKRSDLFGTAYLRLGREMEPGFVLTVEPGIYFIPELMDQWKAEGKHTDFINYDKLDAYRDFGGIRIEDDYLITEEGGHLLGDPVPKTVADVEAVRAEALG